MVLKLKIFSFIFIVFTFIGDCEGQNRRKYFDGPYIKIVDGQKDLMWVYKGRVKKKRITSDTIKYFEVENLPRVDISDLSFEVDSGYQYNGVKRFAAISDIHGQHDLFIEILKAQGIVDSIENWNYGSGHLVVLGDVFDRGDKVTESLWFLFQLEKQAKLAGGKVHLLIGNHELMVLHGDVGYIHPKYRYTAGASRIQYPDLFDENTVLGSWLRSKKIAITINDFVFVHGGFSKKVIEKENSIDKINTTFKTQILPNKHIVKDTNDLISNLYFENGPLWFRGYANPKAFDTKQAEYILNALNKESIVVGHTSMPQIISLYGNRILLVDSSLKFGKTGEILLYEEDELFRGLKNGDRLVLNSDDDESRKSIFDYLYEVSDSQTIIYLNTDVNNLKATKLEKAYQDATVSIIDDRELSYSFDARVKVRGNMRKKLCTNPPLKIDFSKSELLSHGFSNNDKLKLVLQCSTLKSQVASLKKEHLVYELYRQIDTLGLRSKLIQVNLVSDKEDQDIYQGFILEDEANLARRLGGQVVEKGIVRPQAMQREAYLKMAFFQYMICNTDFSVAGRHNIETILLDGEIRLFPIAYDFDYAGIVGQEYAVPADVFPIKDVKDRHFVVDDLTEDELKLMIEFYKSKKEGFLSIINDAEYLSTKNKKDFIKVIDQFYDIITSRKKSKRLLPKK
ncbi:MAG: hypothetical protein HKO66_08090 [Saprospiraceae bacterium]|nr:metallophosphoesterase [Bacteroidia bacterium]NNE14236.1 hypothetical protein [Saprospiraceae bacterium]NNL92177.1 hypothetical protein [Saprospiraceae bacterium]